MLLSALAGDMFSPATADPDITGISEDSRRIEPGMLFVAIRGSAQDGHLYATHAIARGAAALVVEHDVAAPNGIPVLRVPSARQALARLAATFYGDPADGLTLIGFTGTFGKTSTSDIVRALLAAGGAKAGVLGSLGARFDGFHDPGSGLTTPAPVELHRALRGLQEAGADTVILEVTSHALRMERVSGLRFAGALLTAIVSGEHTDFHGSHDDYVAAKRLFLHYLDPAAVLAFDADNDDAAILAGDAHVRTRAGFSLEGRPAAMRLDEVSLDHTGARFMVAGVRMHSTLLGRGHLRNVALALAYAMSIGVSPLDARRVLGGLTPLGRRMESFAAGGRAVLDDTAAHPDSLAATFEVADLVAAGLRARHGRSRTVVVHAIRGNRGAGINRRNALALASLSAAYRTDRLILTAASDTAGEPDRATAEEIDVARSVLAGRGQPFSWHDALAAAMRHASDFTRPGDLIVLTGAQGMNEGRRLLAETLEQF